MSVWKRERAARAGESKRAKHYTYAVRWRPDGNRASKLLTLTVGHTSGHGVQAAALDEYIKSERGNVTVDQARAWLRGDSTDEPEPDDEPEPVPTVRDAMAAWIARPGGRGKSKSEGSRRKYRAIYDALGDLADLPADKLTRAKVNAWFGHWESHGGRKGTGYATTTLNGWVIQLKGSCGRYAPADAFADVSYDSHATDVDAIILTDEQVSTLVAAARVMPDAMLLPVWFLAETGVRFGEMAGLMAGDVDLAAGTVNITRQIPERMRRTTAFVDARDELKGGPRTKRTIKMSDALTNALGLVAELEPTAPAFDPPYAVGDGWRYDGWRKSWARCKRAAGVPSNVRTHDLRHTAAMRWLRAGQPLPVVSRKLGHANTGITDRAYSHWLADDMAAVPVVLG